MSIPRLKGFFPVDREMLYGPAWTIPLRDFKVWVTCMALANFKERVWPTREGPVTIPPGHFIVSLQDLEALVGIKRGALRGSLARLHAAGLIRTRPNPGHWTMIQVLNTRTCEEDTSAFLDEPSLQRANNEPERKNENNKEYISKGPEPCGGSGTREENDFSLCGEEVSTHDRRLAAAPHRPQQNQGTLYRSGSTDESSAGSSVHLSRYAREAQGKADEAKAAMGRAIDWLADDNEDESVRKYRSLRALTSAVEFAQEALANAKQGKLDLKPYEALLEKAQKKLTEANKPKGIESSDALCGRDVFYGMYGDSRDPAEEEAKRLAQENEIRGYAEAANATAAEAEKARAAGKNRDAFDLFFRAMYQARAFIENATGPEWAEAVGEMQEKERYCTNELKRWSPELAGWPEQSGSSLVDTSPTPPVLSSGTNGQEEGASPPEAEDVPGIEEGA